MRAAVLVSGCRGQHFVVARHQPDFDTLQRLGAGQRTRQHMHAVLAGKGGEAKVRHHEPLRRRLRSAFLIIAAGFGQLMRAGLHHINARLQFADRLGNRERGDDILVQLGLHIHHALPDLEAVFIGDLFGAVTGELLEKILRMHGRQQVAVTDAENFNINLVAVDRDNRNAFLPDARQHIAFCRKAHLRRAVPDVDFIICRFQQRLADSRGQALAQYHRIALAMLQRLNAQLLVFRRDGGIGRARNCDKRRKIRLARQRFRKLEAHTGSGQIIVNLVVQNTKTMLLAHCLIDRANLGAIDQRKARPVGVERIAPQLALGLNFAQQRQRLRLVLAFGGALIGGVSGGGDVIALIIIFAGTASVLT